MQLGARVTGGRGLQCPVDGIKIDTFTFLLVENATIPIQFEDYDKVYALEWTELLQVGSEMPFAMYEELEVGMEVLASWKDGRGSHIQY